MTAATKLAEWRRTKGYSQSQAAALVGASQAAWSTWESGRKRPDLEAAHAIERVTKKAVRVRDWIEPAPATSRRTGTDG